jgi:predicted transcriptional regulator
MSENPKSANAFLDTITRSREAGSSSVTTPKVSLKLFSMIPSNEAIPIGQLLGKSDMSFTDFAEALKAIENAGLIEIRGEGTNQTVALTDMGAKLASVV